MIINVNGNMYEVSSDEAWELFGERINGSHAALVCVLSEQSLDTRSRSALNKSAEALGYGADACAFIELGTDDDALDAQALFLLLEGLDPLCLIAADAQAAQTLSAAYRCTVPPLKLSRVFGRTAVAFCAFPSMLNDDKDKQIAWSLLKKLPKLGAR